MKIAIDARFYGLKNKGLGRYVKELVDNLPQIDEKNDYFILLRQDNWDEFEMKSKNVHKILVDYKWYSWQEQLILPFFLYCQNFDLVHFPHFNAPILFFGDFILTIHDLLIDNFPSWRQRGNFWQKSFYWLKFLFYKLTMIINLKKARKIIVSRQFNQKELTKFYQVDQEKVVIIPYLITKFGDNNVENINDKEVLLKYNINRSYILYVGNAYWHKNLDRLLLSVAQIYQKGIEFQTVLVGRDDYYYDLLKAKAEKLGLVETGSVLFINDLPDIELKIFYQNANLYVFPAVYDGFGLPTFEALSCQTPVIMGNKAEFSEVFGSAVDYFDPESISDMATKIENLFFDEKRRNQIVQQGQEIIKKYDNNQIHKQIIDLYHSCLLKTKNKTAI